MKPRPPRAKPPEQAATPPSEDAEPTERVDEEGDRRRRLKDLIDRFAPYPIQEG